MTIDLLTLLFLALTSLAGVGFMKASERHRLQNRLVGYRLSFPRNMETESVARSLRGFSGLLLPWWRRWLAAPFVSLETHADSPRHPTLSCRARGLEPGRPQHPSSVSPSRALRAGTRAGDQGPDRRGISVSDHGRPLLIDAPGLSAKLLASLQPLAERETIVVQWLVTPTVRCLRPKVDSSPDAAWLPLSDTTNGQRSCRRSPQEAGATAAAGVRTHRRIRLDGLERAATTAPSRSGLARVPGPWRPPRAPHAAEPVGAPFDGRRDGSRCRPGR